MIFMCRFMPQGSAINLIFTVDDNRFYRCHNECKTIVNDFGGKIRKLSKKLLPKLFNDTLH